MKNAKMQNRSRKGAFTLIEILVVLVIMGFLISLVAPKLAGVAEEAVDVTNKTSLQRFSDAINEYLKTKKSGGVLPSALTNLIRTDQLGFAGVPDATARLVYTTDNNAGNRVDPLSQEFTERMLPVKHVLNATEAKQLSGFIGKAVINLEAYDTADLTNRAATPVETYVRSQVQAGLPVMMIGAGFDGPADTDAVTWGQGATVTMDGTTVTVDETALVSTLAVAGDNVGAGGTGGSNYVSGTAKTYARIGEAKNVLRIVMGVSNRNMLVVKGFLDESGVSSAQKSNSGKFTYGSYSVILPRLEATVDRFLNTTDNGVAYVDTLGGAVTPAKLTFQAIKFDEQDDGSYKISARTPHMPPARISGGLLKKQTMDATTVTDPLGHNIGERGGWFGVKITTGNGKDVG